MEIFREINMRDVIQNTTRPYLLDPLM